MTRFHVVEGTTPPDTSETRSRKRLAATKTPGMVQCHCGSRTFVTVKTGMVYDKKGNARGGTPQQACAMCLAKGRLVIV